MCIYIYASSYNSLPHATDVLLRLYTRRVVHLYLHQAVVVFAAQRLRRRRIDPHQRRPQSHRPHEPHAQSSRHLRVAAEHIGRLGARRPCPASPRRAVELSVPLARLQLHAGPRWRHRHDRRADHTRRERRMAGAYPLHHRPVHHAHGVAHAVRRAGAHADAHRPLRERGRHVDTPRLVAFMHRWHQRGAVQPLRAGRHAK